MRETSVQGVEAVPCHRLNRFRSLTGWVTGWPLTYLVFLGSLWLYLTTLLPGVLPADSGEFQRVAATAGVAHPPGYPLYTMLGSVFAHLPVGPGPAWRLNLFSAVTAAATVAIVFATARRLTSSPAAGLASALTLGSATTFWATATKASIRPLTALFTALCLYALTRHASQVHNEERTRGDRYLVLFFLALSLGLTHHPSLVFPGTIFLLYLLLIDTSLIREPGRWLKLSVAFLPGLLVLAYLPLRGAPDLATVSGFLDHVLARGFRGDMFALGLLDRVVLLPVLLRFQFNDVLLVGAALGILLLVWRDRKLALLLTGSLLIHLAVTLTYDAPQTVEYAMPAYVCLALLIAVPIYRRFDLSSRTAKIRVVVRILSWVTIMVVLGAGVANMARHYPNYRRLSRHQDTREYVQSLFRHAPDGAIILSNWHWYTPLRYVQEIEVVRPDLTVEYVAPGGEPLADTWVRRIQTHIDQRPVIVARFFEREYEALPYTFEPLGEAFLVRAEPRREAPAHFSPLDAVLGERMEMLGYRISCDEGQPAQPLILELAWSPLDVPAADVALFAQLIGPDGQLWSTAEDPRHSSATLSPGEIVIDHFIIYPRLHALPDDYRLVVGAYSSDGRWKTEHGSEVVLLETVCLRPSTSQPVTQHPRLVRLAGGPTLIGVDYETDLEGVARTYLHWAGPGELTYLHVMGDQDALITDSMVPALDRGEYATVAVDRPGVASRVSALGQGKGRRWNLVFRGTIHLPSPSPGEHYVPFGDAMVLTHASGPTGGLEPGAEATLRLRFHSQRPLERDYIVSTSFTGLEPDGTWAWRTSHDTVPALGAIPTLKWIHGSEVLDPHRMTVPDDASDVPVVGSLLVYDHYTQRSLPNLDERVEPVVNIGSWSVAP